MIARVLRVLDRLGEQRGPNPLDCDGHESLAGEHMGETVYCDGSCSPARPLERDR